MFVKYDVIVQYLGITWGKIAYMAYTTNPKLPKVRMEAVRLVKYRGWSTRKVARYTGFSQSVIVKWCKKDSTGGWKYIPTKSSRPKHHPKELKWDVVKAIIEQRMKHRRCSEIVRQELLNQGIKVGLSSVKRILERAHLIKKHSPWKKYHKSTERPEVFNPGDLVQVDTVHLMKNREERIYVFTLLDLFSRWSYARAFPRAKSCDAARFVEEAQLKAPFSFKHLQTDHGSEFSRYFKQKIGIKHRHSRIRRPNDNAHLERFNRTLQDECLRKLKVDVKVINEALPDYLKYYNERRLHLGLNFKTPIQVIPSY